MTAIPLPSGLAHWTADTAAECLSYRPHLPESYEGGWMALYGRLWSFLADAENPTPLGGDGSDGTVETPDGRLDPRNDDKAPHWWGRLNLVEQRALAAAYADHIGGA